MYNVMFCYIFQVYNLHTKLGKPIPPPNTETAVVSKAATPKVNFVAGMYNVLY